MRSERRKAWEERFRPLMGDWTELLRRRLNGGDDGEVLLQEFSLEGRTSVKEGGGKGGVSAAKFLSPGWLAGELSLERSLLSDIEESGEGRETEPEVGVQTDFTGVSLREEGGVV